jgi:hypothetical protein
MGKHSMAQAMFLDPVNGALGLIQRVQEAPALKAYVRSRLPLIAPVGALMLVTSLACTAGTVLFLAGTRPLLLLVSMLLVPFVLIGSFFVQAYVFCSWIELRALAHALHHSPARAAAPRVPWVLAVLFLVLPLAMLLAVMPLAGIALIALLALAPFGYARLDA